VDTFTAENLGISIKSNSVSSVLELETPQAVAMRIYDINGKLVLSQNLLSGTNAIPVSELTTSVYIIDFTSTEGKKYTTKFVKQ
jgi:hypothetical protein